MPQSGIKVLIGDISWQSESGIFLEHLVKFERSLQCRCDCDMHRIMIVAACLPDRKQGGCKVLDLGCLALKLRVPTGPHFVHGGLDDPEAGLRFVLIGMAFNHTPHLNHVFFHRAL